MTYVGGGWGTAGIHSVLEPAAWGRLVLIGPRDRGSSDAALLERSGGLLRVDRDPRTLAAQWLALLADDPDRRRRGAAARRALEPGRGASERSARLLDKLLEVRTNRARGASDQAP